MKGAPAGRDVRLGWPSGEGAPDVRIEGATWTTHRSARDGKERSLAVLRAVDAAGGRPLLLTAHLGGGAEGEVSLYSSDEGDACAAIKVLAPNWGEEDLEGALLWRALSLRAPEVAALLAPVSVVRTGHAVCLCMPRADCTLEELLPLRARDAFAAAALLADALRALLAEGLAYCDLKPDNVLVVSRDNRLHIALGDHGGLVRAGAGGVATYPPPEAAAGAPVRADARCARWVIGAFVVTSMRGHDRAMQFGKQPDAGERIEAAARGWVSAFGGEAEPAGEALGRCFFGDDRLEAVVEALRRAAGACNEAGGGGRPGRAEDGDAHAVVNVLGY